MIRFHFFAIGLYLGLTCSASAQQVAIQPAAPAQDVAKTLEMTSQKGIDFLLNSGQAEDGSFSKQLGPAITSMCTRALLEHGVSLDHPKVKKALAYLEATIQPDGGIYAKDSVLKNYETCVALVCFQSANKDGKYDEIIQKAAAYLKGLQFDNSKGHELNSDFYGGVSYDAKKRPDASNTSYFIDALQAAGEDADSEAVQKALVFMSRCQNLPSPTNSAEWASKSTEDDRGGLIYTAAGGGESKASELEAKAKEDAAKATGGESKPAGEQPNSLDKAGGLRSYGSMTYAGLKSFLYAGLKKDDIRVKAAIDWIGRHYDVTTNPGMGSQGLYYYYHTFAKALHTMGEPTITDSKGVAHDWRKDLIEHLAKVQNPDGSWTNKADRWYEGDPNLVTSYSMLALSYCKKNLESGQTPKGK